MSTVVLKPNVQTLQEEVLRVLASISDLMDQASRDFGADVPGSSCAHSKTEVDGALEKVKRLELRMAIVAPMKAGKSTIINAIVGQDLLPNRNAAMTTLPTEIVLKAEALEPVLELNSKTLSVFQESYRSLKLVIHERGMEWVKRTIAEYPHLDQLVQEIKDTDELIAQARTQGHEEIGATLARLNDLVRLSALLECKDLLDQFVEVPCIKTSFWKAQASAESGRLGNLVIVDTPGPNEAGGDFGLAEVVKEQLKRSSIVLLVLDFTQLNTEAADKVKKEVHKVSKVRRKEHLYVLVNKVDQRLDGDMTSEEVEQFVAAQFDIGSNDAKRVFEVSARLAFSAANFTQELNQNPGIKVADLKTAKPLARLAHGLRWERKLKWAIENNNIEGLQDDALEVWADSGFDSFLKEAVNALVERAAPGCIQAALDLCQIHLEALKKNAEFRSQAIAKEAGDLQQQVNELEVDLKRLEVCYTKMTDVSRIKADLHQELSKAIASLQDSAKVSLEMYWDHQEYQRADFIGKSGIQARNFTNWIGEKFGVKIEKGKGLIECRTESEAEEFTRQATNFAKKRVSGLIEQTRNEAEQRIQAACQKLIRQLEAETKPIIEKAHQRLNEFFDINFMPPNFSLSVDEPRISRPDIKSKYRYIDQGYEARNVEKRSFWHWCWIVPYTETERIKRPDKREDYYTVSLEELIEKANRSIEAHIQALAQNINNYIDQDFKDRVNFFFESLDNYLCRYKQSLQQAQEDKKLSQDNKEALAANLANFISEADSELERIQQYDGYVKEILEEMQ